MSTREAVHAEVDQLPEGALETLSRALARWREDPMQFAIDTAPFDDEPESEAEREGVASAKAQIAAGLGVQPDEVVRLLNEVECPGEDSFKAMLDSLPIDDEPLTPAERAALDARRNSIAPVFTMEQVEALLHALK